MTEKKDRSRVSSVNRAGAAVARVLIENDRVRVTEWRFDRRGDNTGWHRHEHDYVVIPLFDGSLDITDTDENTRNITLQCGIPYYRPIGIEHDVVSANDFACKFVEVEILA